MIAFLRGKPVSSGHDYLIIDVGGIGYKVFVPAPVLGRVTDPDQPVTVHTYLYVREDLVQLYGFIDESDRRIFELLIQVSGIGPKVALAVLSAMNSASFVQAVINEQVHLLTQISGVGKKTAQRIIVELKDKFSKMDVGVDAESMPVSAADTDKMADALQALTALGYNPVEAKRALAKAAQAAQEPLPLEAMVRLALKELARY